MARRRPTPPLPDTVRDAVERTIQATLGSAQTTRGRAEAAVDDIVRGAEASAEAVRDRVRGAIEEARPATPDDLRDIRRELATITRRLDEIESRLPGRGATKPDGATKSSGRATKSRSGTSKAKGKAPASSSRAKKR